MRFTIISISVLIFTVQPLPIFKIANDYDRYGKQCPLFPQYNVECPILCVKSHDLSPQNLTPHCPAGQQFCLDGTCQTLCDSSIPNPCLCNNPSAPPNYVPCAANQLVNITHFNPRLKELQTRELCASNANIPNTTPIGLWGFPNATTTDLVWAQCPATAPAHFTFKEPMWIAVWVISATEAVILFTWHIYKYFRELKYKRRVKKSRSLILRTTNSYASVVEKLKTEQHVEHEIPDNIDKIENLKKNKYYGIRKPFNELYKAS